MFKFRHGATLNGTELRVHGDEQGEGECGEGDEHVRVCCPRVERGARACGCVPASRDRAGWFGAGRHLAPQSHEMGASEAQISIVTDPPLDILMARHDGSLNIPS